MFGESKFGSTFPEICETCHRDELQFLSKPRSSEDHMTRVMTIKRCCTRCNNTCFQWPEFLGYCDVTICLPVSLIADSTSFAQRHQASTKWGIKPSCADLQLVNLECAARDPFRRRAYLTVGHAAMLDELVFHGPGLLDCILQLCCFRNAKGSTSWRLCNSARSNQSDPPSDRIQEVDEGDDGQGDDANPAAAHSPSRSASHQQNGGRTDAELALEQALEASNVEEQRRAYVEGGVLHSTTTLAPGQRPELVEPPGLEGGCASGTRQARARFPQITSQPNFLHSNNEQNLQMAHDMRNVGVGDHNPLQSEVQTRDRLVELLKQKVFTPGRLRKAMVGFESARVSALPKKLSEEERMRVELEAMNAALSDDGVGFDTVIKAFVKSEVTAKNKPRPIANHGNVRLYALAKVAYAFEHVMFETFRGGSIKGRGKKEAIEELFSNMSNMKHGRWVENDLTSFEFGISEPLKQIEMDIFYHIAKIIGVADTGALLFERVSNDRDKCATWKLIYTDETGQKRTAKIKIPQTMRESGDRVTSSGNFLQNLIAWFCFLVDPDYVEDALESLIKHRGSKLFYVSRRDRSTIELRGKQVRKKYLACLAFEGDDTSGRIEEPVWVNGPYDPENSETKDDCLVSNFFRRWGWKAKLIWKPHHGDAYVRFVGYEALIHDSKIVYDGAEMVMTPEARRLLNTKSWTTTAVTPAELKTCIRVYAASLADGFKRVEPMYAFLNAVFDSNKGGVDVDAQKVKEYLLAVEGEMPEHGRTVNCPIDMPPFEGGDADKWKRLLRRTAGDFDEREWAQMCHIGTIDIHGEDLATSVPAEWRN